MKPEIIIIPNCGVNRNVADLNAALIAAQHKIPVLDLNSQDKEFSVSDLNGVHKVGFSVRTFALNEMRRLEAVIKQRFPDVETGTVSGPIDVLCCYKYEKSSVDFDAEIEFGDEMEFPDYDSFSSIRFLTEQWQRGDFQYPIMTSLGCPYACKFCMAGKRKWRPRSAENCAAEVKRAAERWGISAFQILDDCFNFNHERVMEFCALVKPLNVKWYCNNGLRADRINEEQARAMYDAGCRHITFGIESANDDILKAINKGENLEQISDAIEYTSRAGIQTAGFFLIGLPGSSFEIDMKSLEWARARKISPHFSYFVPPEHWNDGNKQFWGQKSVPLSDAYPAEDQEKVYNAAWRQPSILKKLIKRISGK